MLCFTSALCADPRIQRLNTTAVLYLPYCDFLEVSEVKPHHLPKEIQTAPPPAVAREQAAGPSLLGLPATTKCGLLLRPLLSRALTNSERDRKTTSAREGPARSARSTYMAKSGYLYYRFEDWKRQVKEAAVRGDAPPTDASLESEFSRCRDPQS